MSLFGRPRKIPPAAKVTTVLVFGTIKITDGE
jgi:hypothetical protein